MAPLALTAFKGSAASPEVLCSINLDGQEGASPCGAVLMIECEALAKRRTDLRASFPGHVRWTWLETRTYAGLNRKNALVRCSTFNHSVAFCCRYRVPRKYGEPEL